MADMPIREAAITTEINDKLYRIRKMPPWTATYMVKFVAAKFLPILTATEGLLGQKATEDGGKGNVEINGDQLSKLLTEDLPNILNTVT